MKVRIDFTLEIPKSHKTALEILAGGGPFAEEKPDVRDFLQYDAERYLVDYLTDNGVEAEVIRRA